MKRRKYNIMISISSWRFASPQKNRLRVSNKTAIHGSWYVELLSEISKYHSWAMGQYNASYWKFPQFYGQLIDAWSRPDRSDQWLIHMCLAFAFWSHPCLPLCLFDSFLFTTMLFWSTMDLVPIRIFAFCVSSTNGIFSLLKTTKDDESLPRARDDIKVPVY